MTPPYVEIWAGLTCPWSLLGMRRLDRFLRSHDVNGAPAADAVTITIHLVVPATPTSERSSGAGQSGGVGQSSGSGDKSKSFGSPRPLQRRFEQLAKADGISLFEGGPHGDLWNAYHSLGREQLLDAALLLRAAHGRQRSWAVLRALYAAHFIEGRDITDRAELLRLGGQLGLGEAALSCVFDADKERTRTVEALDQAEVEASSGLPVIWLNRTKRLVGVPSLEALESAWVDAVSPPVNA